MFDELWDIIENFPHFYVGTYTIEVCVPLNHYRTVRSALLRHLRKYPGESFVLTLDHL